jgi:hypothetical protein
VKLRGFLRKKQRGKPSPHPALNLQMFVLLGIRLGIRKG